MSLYVYVLGSGAGGGFPQWNCRCDLCIEAREGQLISEQRTQSSIAISSDKKHWILINASPDIRAQLLAAPHLGPQTGLRDSAIEAIVLMDAQIDHTSGLLSLREHNKALELYCTEPVRSDLSGPYPLIPMLDHYCGVNRHNIDIAKGSFSIAGFEQLSFKAVPLLSNAPPYSPRRDKPINGDNIGLVVEDKTSGKTLFYAPGLGDFDERINALMSTIDVHLIDGTVWTDTEMIDKGLGTKTGAAMGHLAVGDPDGSKDILSQFPNSRRILIHINNSNPMLDPAGDERAVVENAGIEVAYDGMMIEI